MYNKREYETFKMLKPCNLYPWQKRSANLLADRKQCALFADPGDGKTVTTLTALAVLKPGKTLIIAPAKVCSEKVWEKEASSWSHLHRARFTNLQQLSAKKRAVALKDNSHFHVISYSLIPWILDNLKPFKLDQCYQAVVFDELSNLKNTGATRFKRLRRPIIRVPIRFGLTGSPTGNELLNIWPEMFMVAGVNPLGPSVSDFREQYFESDYQGWTWTPKEGAERQILDRLKPYALYVPNARGTKRSERIVYKPIRHSMPKAIQAQYEELKAEYVATIGDGEEIYSPNAAVLVSKLKQLESGAIYKNIEPGEEPTGEWSGVHDERINATVELANSLEGQQLLVFYEYDHERQRLQAKLKDVIHINDDDAIARWNNGSVRIMLAHPKSAGHGLNLHLGGAYNMLFFNSPWSWELAEQCMGRLDRSGQKKRVNVYHFSGLSISDDVVRRWKIHEKRQIRVKQAVAI